MRRSAAGDSTKVEPWSGTEAGGSSHERALLPRCSALVDFKSHLSGQAEAFLGSRVGGLLEFPQHMLNDKRAGNANLQHVAVDLHGDLAGEPFLVTFRANQFVQSGLEAFGFVVFRMACILWRGYGRGIVPVVRVRFGPKRFL